MTIPARPFGALLCAMVTPMHEDGELDLDAAANLARYLIDHGHDGLVLSGTTGEAPTTHAPEKVELIRAVREAVGPDVPILSGAGSNDTAHAVRMAEQAAKVLQEQQAEVKLVTYAGGHGWRGRLYDDIRGGLEWLERPAASSDPSTD